MSKVLSALQGRTLPKSLSYIEKKHNEDLTKEDIMSFLEVGQYLRRRWRSGPACGPRGAGPRLLAALQRAAQPVERRSSVVELLPWTEDTADGLRRSHPTQDNQTASQFISKEQTCLSVLE